MKAQRFSKCGETGDYKNTCRNPRANFDADYPSDVVSAEDLLSGNGRNALGLKDMNGFLTLGQMPQEMACAYVR